jgi:hypothetical protein
MQFDQLGWIEGRTIAIEYRGRRDAPCDSKKSTRDVSVWR